MKLRPVGTLACHVRRTRASSQANIYRVASRPFARDSGACKKEFHSRNEVKIVRLRFLYINDSPPLDWHIILLSFQPETSERAMNFFFFSSFLFFFSKNEWIEKYFFLPRNIEVELCEFYSVFQFFFVEMLQLINIGTF